MLYHFSTLGQLRSAVDSFIQILGEDARVGTQKIHHEPFQATLFPVPAGVPDELTLPEGTYVETCGQLDWVMVDKYGKIVGTEADDYRKKNGKHDAIRIA